MENVDIRFNESEWKLFRLIENMPEDSKIQITDLAEQLGESIRATKRNLAQLTELGFLTQKTFTITNEGELAYQRHLRWWNAIIWLLQSWGLPEDQLRSLADSLLCETTSQMVEGIIEQNEKSQVMVKPDADSEYIDNTDFYGQIETGSYVEGVCFWDLDDNSGYFRNISPVSEWFAPQANFIVELQKSRLELRWTNKEVQLEGISYYMTGREHFQQPEGGTINLPIMAFSFTRVARYRMLEGQLDVTVKALLPSEERISEYRVKIELPMLFNRSCDKVEGESYEQ